MGDPYITPLERLRIGFCYDLKSGYIAERIPEELVSGFESIKTIDAITTALKNADFIVTHLGDIRQLVQHRALFSRDKSLNASELFRTALVKSKHSNELSKFPLFIKPVG